MSVSVFGVLAIAAVFFLVTMGIAVGPLMMCRLLAGPGRDERPPQSTRFSLAGAVLTACSVLIGLGVGAVLLYFVLRPSAHRHVPATIVHEVTPPFENDLFHPGLGMPHAPPSAAVAAAGTSSVPLPVMPFEVAEQSLFAEPQLTQTPRQAISRSDLFELGSIALTYLMLFAVAGAVLSQQVRTFLARTAPVMLAVVLLGTLFLWTSHRRSVPPQVQTSLVASADLAEAPLPPPVASPPAVATVAADAMLAQTFESVQDAAAGDASPVPDAADQPVLTYVGTSTAAERRAALPEWTQRADIHGPIRVVDSGLHATVKLAEEHALAKLRSLLQQEMASRSPETAGWQAPDQIVLNSGSILQRAVERSQIQVGENVIPMYEAYWQVNTGSIEPLYRAWQPSVVRQRLIQMGAGIALLTLLLASIAGTLKVDEQTQGRRRKSLAIATLTIWGFVAGIALFVA